MSEPIRDGYKMTEMGEMPEEWVIKKIGDILILKGGSIRHCPKNQLFQ